MTERMNDSTARKETIIQAALRVAKRDGFEAIEKTSIAKEGKFSDALLYHYFKGVPEIKKLVMKRAVAGKLVPIVSRGIALGYTEVRGIPEGLKNEAVEYMLAGDK